MSGQITVYSTSDVHAHWATPDRGLARVLGALAERDPETSLLVDNGDLLTGSALGAMLADQDAWATADNQDVAGPHPLLAELESAGYDVWVPGNHDFDHGVDWLQGAVRGLQRMRVLCANVFTAVGTPLFAASTVFVRGGARVGVIGAVTGHLQRLSRYQAVRGLRCTDPVAAVAAEVARLRDECDWIIVAYHGGFVRDPETGASMHYETGEDQAASILDLPGVDGVIAGHQHTMRAGVSRSGMGAYVQPGYAGEVVGELILTDRTRAARLIHTASAHPRSGRFDALQGQVAEWLSHDVAIDDSAVHRLVADRLGGATALALPAQPRTLEQLVGAFAGVYGVSRVRLPVEEFAESLNAARAAGLNISVRGVSETASDVEVLINSALRPYLPAGRIQADSVVDWLDEIVYARRRGVLAEREQEPIRAQPSRWWHEADEDSLTESDDAAEAAGGVSDVSPQARIAAVHGELRPSERRVVEVIVQSPELIVESSAEQLAAMIGIARTSVIRAAQRLGYPGYAQLRVAVLRSIVPERASPPANTPGLLGSLRADIAAVTARMPDTLELLREDDLTRVVDLLVNSARILCLANGLSGPLAADFAMRLAGFGLNAEAPADAFSQQVMARHFTARDVLIAISGSGANQLTLRSLSTARDNGAHTVAVTSFANSPVTAHAGLSLVVPSVRGTFQDEIEHTSRIALAVFLDALTARVEERLGAVGRRARDRTLEVIADNLIDEAGAG